MAVRLFSYFGSKVRIAKRYPAPVYPTIVEPFAGAAGYSCLHFHKQVRLWEVNPTIHGAINYIIQSDPEAIRSLPLLGNADSIDDLRIEQEAKWLIGLWSATAAAHPGKCLYKWAREGGNKSGYWSAKCRRRLAVTAAKIKHWEVHLGSYTDIPVDEIGPATWFVDPPYQDAGRHYPFGSSLIDYTKLGEWCRALPGQVIVCENEGADWLPFRPLCSFSGAAKAGKSRRITTEAVWMQNGNEYPGLFRRANDAR